MLGPKRFKDLLDGLPSIGRNLLSARMRHLESEGVVRRRRLPPPAGSRVYELTRDGWSLGPAMAELARWGVARLGKPRPGQVFQPAWAMFPLSYTADPDAARGVHETYEFRIDDETFHLRVADGSVVPRTGGADRPDLTVTMDRDTLLDLFSGELPALEGLSSGRISVAGSPEVLQRAVAILAGG
jgi:hypothetical protein